MPIYLVRWPDLSVAVVKARNEVELLAILDEVDHPAGCRWERLSGSFYFEIGLNAKWHLTERERNDKRMLVPEDIHIDDVSEMVPAPNEIGLPQDALRASFPDLDSNEEIRRRLFSFCFPHLGRALAEPREGEPTAKQLSDALAQELVEQIRAQWAAEAEHRSGHPLAELAKRAGTSIQALQVLLGEPVDPPKGPGRKLAIKRPRRKKRSSG